MIRRRSRRDIENNNFKRQAQALTILTIATVILGGALFQVDISVNNLFSTTQLQEVFQAAFVLLTALLYLVVIIGVADTLTQTTLLNGKDIVDKVINPMLLQLLSAIFVFFIGLLTK